MLLFYARNLRKRVSAKLILRAHSMNEYHYKNLFKIETRIIQKIVYALEFLKFKFLKKNFNYFDKVLFITREENLMH